MILPSQARRWLQAGLAPGLRGPAFQALRSFSGGSSGSSTSLGWDPHMLGKQEGPWEVGFGGAALGARGVLQLAGPDAPKLLQGLVTNDVVHLPVPQEKDGGGGQQAAMAVAFLTNKGRIITDAIVMVARDAQAAPHGGPDKLLIDLPLGVKDAVLRHLRLFKLRAKVTITDLSSSTRVRVLVGPNAVEAARDAWGSRALGLATDPRTPADAALGVRAVLPAAETETEAAASSSAAAAVERERAYEALRLLHGVPEGHDLVERLPSECNLDLLHAVNFAKGCYLGQELTARTQFKGVVRKRLLPFFIGDFAAGGAPPGPSAPSLQCFLPGPDASPLLASALRVGPFEDTSGVVAAGAEVLDAGSGKALGTVVTSAWPRTNVGLALLRLEGVLGQQGGAGPLRLVAAGGGEGEGEGKGEGAVVGERVPVTAFTPLWWPALDLATGKVPS